MHQFFLGLKFGSRCWRRISNLVVPGTNVLTDVAAEDVMTYGITKLQRHVSPFLDGKVRNASPCIHLPGSHKRLSGTGIKAARTAAAAIGSGAISSQFQRSENDSQENPRAQLRVNQAGILANPPNSSIFGVYPFHDGAGIDITGQ